MVISF